MEMRPIRAAAVLEAGHPCFDCAARLQAICGVLDSASDGRAARLELPEFIAVEDAADGLQTSRAVNARMSRFEHRPCADGLHFHTK